MGVHFVKSAVCTKFESKALQANTKELALSEECIHQLQQPQKAIVSCVCMLQGSEGKESKEEKRQVQNLVLCLSCCHNMCRSTHMHADTCHD